MSWKGFAVQRLVPKSSLLKKEIRPHALRTRTDKIRVTTLLYSSLTEAASGSTDILLRVNGRTRHGLIVTHAAPGPCSARLSVPLSTNRGSLNGISGLTLPFTALLYERWGYLTASARFCQALF